MRKTIALIAVGLAASAAACQAAVVMDFGSPNWEYSNDNGVTWKSGLAPFGNYSYCNTYWAENSDILVKTAINLTGFDPSSATYFLGIDNDCFLSVNGMEIRDIYHGGVAGPYDWSGTLTGAQSGINNIQLRLHDYGGGTYFDMQISANLVPVPEPSTYLAGIGALGMLFLGLRNRK